MGWIRSGNEKGGVTFAITAAVSLKPDVAGAKKRPWGVGAIAVCGLAIVVFALVVALVAVYPEEHKDAGEDKGNFIGAHSEWSHHGKPVPSRCIPGHRCKNTIPLCYGKWIFLQGRRFLRIHHRIRRSLH